MTTLDDLRRFTVARSLPSPTTLRRAMRAMGFVQADPIRAPARAQDLVLRHRVTGYRAGDLERAYPQLDVAEDFFVNYGFVTAELQALMHPRPNTVVPAQGTGAWHPEAARRALRILAFVRERGVVHPRDVDERFAHGKVTNWWGGTSKATTQLLDAMHYRGLLRVARREQGIRLYAAHEHAPAPRGRAERTARLDALVDAVVRIYAPLPSTTFAFFVRRLRFAAPQHAADLTDAIRRAKARLDHERVDGLEWYWPAGERPEKAGLDDAVRLLAPFDPIVQDRARFELLWGWTYRFEAYTPAPKRKLGYYALPLLWRGRVIGWGNLSVKDGALVPELGYVDGKPHGRTFARELDAELERLRSFLAL